MRLSNASAAQKSLIDYCEGTPKVVQLTTIRLVVSAKVFVAKIVNMSFTGINAS